MTWAALWIEALALMGAPADLPPPSVVYDDRNDYECVDLDLRKNKCGLWEIYVVDDECLQTNFIHEASHAIAVETGRLNGVPNDKVKDRLEDIARDVEQRASIWSPNCESPTP